MKRLSSSQLAAVQELADYAFIQSATVEFASSGLSRITITSVPGADWNKVDQAINDEFDHVFPELEYYLKPVTYVSPISGNEEELFFINFEGETLINLIMKKGPASSRDRYIEFHENRDELQMKGDQ